MPAGKHRLTVRTERESFFSEDHGDRTVNTKFVCRFSGFWQINKQEDAACFHFGVANIDDVEKYTNRSGTGNCLAESDVEDIFWHSVWDQTQVPEVFQHATLKWCRRDVACGVL